MHLYQKDADKLLKELRDGMISEIKSKFDFFLHLLDEDDWSFVIKAHAMVEAATTQMIIHQLGEERLKSVVERLPLSNTSTGKIAVAREMGLLSAEQHAFIRAFSELRNKLVHRVENLEFTFTKHFGALDSNQRKAWSNSVTWFARDASLRKKWQGISQKNPKIALFMAVSMLVSECVINSRQAKGVRKIRHEAEKSTTMILKRLA